MSKGKFESAPRPRRKGSKAAALILALVLVVGCVVGGTLAWLTAKSDVVTNTFTTSDITVELKETTGNAYKMIPGYTIRKDPKATVVSGSEECWLFVKLVMENNTYTKGETSINYLSYEIAEGWEKVEEGVYARKVFATDIASKTQYSVLKNDQVTVSGDVTKEMMEAANTAQPKLTITAYASQLHKNATEDFDVLTAWNNINTK